MSACRHVAPAGVEEPPRPDEIFILCDDLRRANGLQFGMGFYQVESYCPCNGPQNCDGPTTDCYAGWGSFCNNSPNMASISWNYSDDRSNPGVFSSRSKWQCTFAKIADGLSQTIMLSERRGDLWDNGSVFSPYQGVITSNRINSANFNLAADNDYKNNMGAISRHSGGASFCMADGGVRFFTNDIDFQLYNYLGGRADGQSGNAP